jgi:hypothetical protein
MECYDRQYKKMKQIFIIAIMIASVLTLSIINVPANALPKTISSHHFSVDNKYYFNQWGGQFNGGYILSPIEGPFYHHIIVQSNITDTQDNIDNSKIVCIPALGSCEIPDMSRIGDSGYVIPSIYTTDATAFHSGQFK